MRHTSRIAVWLGTAALVAAHAVVALAATNVAPTAVVISAAQRPGTTYMDIDYRVNDPDDATVQTAALGFVPGNTYVDQETFLQSIVRISTLMEGTAANLGTNVPANTNLHLTWNVGADWNTNFGNLKVEILAKDARGLLPFHWITLPTNGPNPEITINDRPIYDSDLLPIWYWLIATGDPAVQFVNGQVFGVGGNYGSCLLATYTATTVAGRDFLWERFGIRSLSGGEIARAKAGRYGLQSVDRYSVAKGLPDRVYAWGANDSGQLLLAPSANITAVALTSGATLVLAGGGVTGWGYDSTGNEITVPASATNIVAIAAGSSHYLALKANGTVASWVPDSYYGVIELPARESNVVAIAAGDSHSLALKANGTVVSWGRGQGGDNYYCQLDVPASATNVVAIAAGAYHSLALKADGTVVGWGACTNYDVDQSECYGQAMIPASATNVVAIAAGYGHSLALKANGTVVGWGWNDYGQTTIPASATNVVAISAGFLHSLALRADGTVIVWGDNYYGERNVPAGVSGIDLIGTGWDASHIVVVDKRTP